MKPLYEQYRPKSFDQVVGQDKAIAKIKQIVSRGCGGRAWWISGKSGVGKTTLAYLIAEQVVDRKMVREIDASEATPARLREIEDTCRHYSLFGGHAYIINEAHGLRRDSVRQLLVWLERLPEHVCVIFTTTNEGEERLFEDDVDASPLMSRCIRIALAAAGLGKAFAERAKAIAMAEGLDGQPLSAYEKLSYKHKCNMRAMLQDIESGAMME